MDGPGDSDQMLADARDAVNRAAAVPQPKTLASAIGTEIAIFLGIAAIYFFLAKEGLQLASLNASISPIWPATGFAIAAFVLWGPKRAIVPIVIGAYLANVTTTGVVATSLAIALGNALEAAIIGTLVNVWADGKRAFDTPACVARFVLLALASGTLVGASIGVGTLVAAGSAGMNDAGSLWMTWWLGDSAGALVVTPLVMLWAQGPPMPGSKDLRESLIVFASAVVVGVIAYSPIIDQSTIRAPLGFLAILPLLAAALRLTQRDTATVAVILSGFAVWGTILGAGPFGQSNINDSFLLLLTFMISITVPSLALSADVAERRRQEKGLRAIVEQAQMGIAQSDTTGRLLIVNAKYCEIVGRTQAELLGGLRREDVIEPADRARDNELFANACRTGEGYTNEKRILRPDGTTLWIWNNVTPVVADDGKVNRIVSMCADITDRHTADERQTLLMAELNHRVRNTLATIQAMARLTATAAPSKEAYVESLQGRIATMARTHELLTRERWQGVSIEDLLRDELRPYAPRGESLAVKGPKIKLGPRQALDIALAVHELATNAAKYGALSTPEGRVSIVWSTVQVENEPTLRVEWQETGGPTVTAPTKVGFGSKLIRNTFGGAGKKAEWEYLDTGVRCVLETPIEVGTRTTH